MGGGISLPRLIVMAIGAPCSGNNRKNHVAFKPRVFIELACLCRGTENPIYIGVHHISSQGMIEVLAESVEDLISRRSAAFSRLAAFTERGSSWGEEE